MPPWNEPVDAYFSCFVFRSRFSANSALVGFGPHYIEFPENISQQCKDLDFVDARLNFSLLRLYDDL